MPSFCHASGLPLVYPCSDCCNASEMANYLASNLERKGIAEMSSIAGVGGGIQPLVQLARSGRPVLALDGCLLTCVKASLGRCGIEPHAHVVLSDYGVQRHWYADFDWRKADALLSKIERIVLTLWKP